MSNWVIFENKPNFNPKQSQSKPISPPPAAKYTLFKPNLSRRSLWRSRIKPNFPKSQQSHFSLLLICVKNSGDFGSDIVRRSCFTRYTSRRMHKKKLRILSIFLRQFNDSLPISCKLRLY
jgi:hypothetical protein